MLAHYHHQINNVYFVSLTVRIVKLGALVPLDADCVGPGGCIGIVRALQL